MGWINTFWVWVWVWVWLQTWMPFTFLVTWLYTSTLYTCFIDPSLSGYMIVYQYSIYMLPWPRPFWLHDCIPVLYIHASLTQAFRVTWLNTTTLYTCFLDPGLSSYMIVYQYSIYMLGCLSPFWLHDCIPVLYIHAALTQAFLAIRLHFYDSFLDVMIDLIWCIHD